MVEERARARARARRGICRGHSQRRTCDLEIQDVLTCIKQRGRNHLACPHLPPPLLSSLPHLACPHLPLLQHHSSVRIRSIFRAVPSWGQNMNILITRGTVHIVLLVYTVTCNNVCLVFTTCNTRCIVFTTCNTRWCLLGAKHEHPIPLFYTCQHILNF